MPLRCRNKGKILIQPINSSLTNEKNQFKFYSVFVNNYDKINRSVYVYKIFKYKTLFDACVLIDGSENPSS